MPPAWHQAMAAHLERDMARRIALPERPADPLAGTEWVRVLVITRHQTSTLVASIPAQHGIRRPRSDQFAVALDGEQVATLEGRTAIVARIGALLPVMMSRKQRDEADRLHEQDFAEGDAQ